MHRKQRSDPDNTSLSLVIIINTPEEKQCFVSIKVKLICPRFYKMPKIKYQMNIKSITDVVEITNIIEYIWQLYLKSIITDWRTGYLYIATYQLAFGHHSLDSRQIATKEMQVINNYNIIQINILFCWCKY